jgi:hypothetical protein
VSSSTDFFPSEVRPRRTPLRWTRRRPLGWLATAYHGVYEIRPHLKEHHIDGQYRLAWRRGDGFSVRYRPVGAAPGDDDTHLPGVTTWHWQIAEAKAAIALHHEDLVRANRAPSRRPRTSKRIRAARADLRDARARLAALIQPSLRLTTREEVP